MHRFLQLQRRRYRIIFLEQDNERLFNRAKLLNSAMRELCLNGSVPQFPKFNPYSALRFESFECFVFHDIDKLPKNKEIAYWCGPEPTQLVRAKLGVERKTMGEQPDVYYSKFMGGVTIFNRWNLILVNGASNNFRGWGGEDDDLYARLRLSGISVNRLPDEVGVYLTQEHRDDMNINSNKDYLLKRSLVIERLLTDGFAQVNYNLVNFIEFPLYTVLKLDV
ncbi:UDP-Gal betaGlcNAc beta [Cichlidogyrus casuarinus]|uniref:UDP-Gal betaGlcNAc beta n=1 Tax=Cichlidogyrus casuarinus TaxID=1844966 RepID=A0ABD2PM80_9PLAT